SKKELHVEAVKSVVGPSTHPCSRIAPEEQLPCARVEVVPAAVPIIQAKPEDREGEDTVLTGVVVIVEGLELLDVFNRRRQQTARESADFSLGKRGPDNQAIVTRPKQALRCGRFPRDDVRLSAETAPLEFLGG